MYAANAGSSGTDTFTFKANDGFLNSNVATLVATIYNCASDISGSVTVTKGPLKLNKRTGRYTQSVTLRNGDGAISGPVSLVLDNLSSNATLFAARGATTCTTPTGSPRRSAFDPPHISVGDTADLTLSRRRSDHISRPP